MVKLRDRARAYYGRLGTLLERISEAQHFASSAMLELLNRSIDKAQATIAATEATVNEEKGVLIYYDSRAICS